MGANSVEIILETGEAEGVEFSVSYWKVDTGARVASGDELVVLESTDDKTALVVLSSHTGKLVEILVSEEQIVSAGDTLGRIEVD